MIEDYKQIVYGTIIEDTKGQRYKVVDGKYEDALMEQPIFTLQEIPKEKDVFEYYITKCCTIVKDNPIGRKLFEW